MVTNIDWPSPFTRIGPALPGDADAPVPEFGAHGGNCDGQYAWRSEMGVWGLNAEGQLEDHTGTSVAAPLLSREAALAFAELQKACAPGTRVYAATVKAYLALTARPYDTREPVKRLTERTLGFGKASAERLVQPAADSAVFVWQGLLDAPETIMRVALPIPRAWLARARSPELRLVCAWDTPVNSAARGHWGCRKVTAQLRPEVAGPTLGGSQARHPTHPLRMRTFNLSGANLRSKHVTPRSDLWIIEVSYTQVADYLASMEFSPKQRVAFAAELSDRAEEPVSPQSAIQALPIASTMVRLSASVVAIAAPVTLKWR